MVTHEYRDSLLTDFSEYILEYKENIGLRAWGQILICIKWHAPSTSLLSRELCKGSS